MDDAERQLWREYQADRSVDRRNALVERYRPLLKKIAFSMSHLPVEQDELEGYGAAGLIDAVERFDPDRGLAFATYASHRIRGTILDGARGFDWVPRLARSRHRQRGATADRLRQELGREPDEDDLREAMGELAWSDSRTPEVSSMQAEKRGVQDEGKVFEHLADLHDPASAALLRDVETRQALKDMLTGLARVEKIIIIMYYYESMTMKEIGLAAGLSESRVSQLHSSILARLRSRLTDPTR